MSSDIRKFMEGELDREIALLGLSLEEFAARAEITDKTLMRARKGFSLHTKTWGKILTALGARPSDLAQLVRAS